MRINCEKMIRHCESLCQSVSQLRCDDKKMANHFTFLKSNLVCVCMRVRVCVRERVSAYT